MKIVAINGSPRKNGNTARLLEAVGKEVRAAGVEFEVFQPGHRVYPCMACYHCLNTGSLRCVQTDDMVNDIIAACIEADGILLASPVYHGGIAGNMKCVLDRLMLAAGCGDNQLHHKVGGALCTLRRSGGMETYQQLLGTMDAMEMLIVTSDYWGAVHGADPGECLEDAEGMEVACKLGRNMAWAVKALAAAKETVPPPATARRTMTNFIR
ncbi:flavodoxin family protein [uncultured Oscillibacter sp.]|uniref:flavodoxin family protein n=1 Tax=uncultured Oscillibacter sp. TaxID=876091 RepID=UPI00280BC819|nr:flavodoxin family protein [uncultured Oscillibacter sp.]